MTVDTCFDEVVRGCQRQHGKGCWLHPSLVEAFRKLHTPHSYGAVDCDPKRPAQRDRPRNDETIASTNEMGACPNTAGHSFTADAESTFPAFGATCVTLKGCCSLEKHEGTGVVMHNDAACKRGMGMTRSSAFEEGYTSTRTQSPHPSSRPSAESSQSDGNLGDGPDLEAKLRESTRLMLKSSRASHKDKGRVRFHSFELWSEGKLVAGELGYSFGACYTSISGFYLLPSSGTVQCIATARILQRSGVRCWDLGMELPYKLHLGARCIPRREFLRTLAEVRDIVLPASLHARRVWVPELLGKGPSCAARPALRAVEASCADAKLPQRLGVEVIIADANKLQRSMTNPIKPHGPSPTEGAKERSRGSQPSLAFRGNGGTFGACKPLCLDADRRIVNGRHDGEVTCEATGTLTRPAPAAQTTFFSYSPFHSSSFHANVTGARSFFTLRSHNAAPAPPTHSRSASSTALSSKETGRDADCAVGRPDDVPVGPSPIPCRDATLHVLPASSALTSASTSALEWSDSSEVDQPSTSSMLSSGGSAPNNTCTLMQTTLPDGACDSNRGPNSLSKLGHTVSSTLTAVSNCSTVREAMRKGGWDRSWSQPWASHLAPLDMVLVSVGSR
mmetsp:Transcript_21544/g.59252  ORF Transcript_21544/g.59252 Transcript_21544/m.59252 type:complete len:619 (-) Transcript_21544:706-2562(-)